MQPLSLIARSFVLNLFLVIGDSLRARRIEIVDPATWNEDTNECPAILYYVESVCAA